MLNRTNVFTLLFIVSIIFFLWNCYKRFGYVTLGKSDKRFGDFIKRFWAMLYYAFGQKRVVSRPFGFNHFIIFWSFIILLIANTEFIVNGIIPSISLAILPQNIYNTLVYILDIVSLATLVSILVAMSRRLFFAPSYLSTKDVKAKSFEAFLILSFIGLLMIAFFGINASEIALAQMDGSYKPISSMISGLFANVQVNGLEIINEISWWIHAIVLLAFMNFLPLSKHMHIMTAIPNCYFRNLDNPNTLPREEFKIGNTFGVGKVNDFTWKDLFDSYSCTECGRCQDVCPATNTKKPLNPRQIIHDIKINLLANAELIKKDCPPKLSLIGNDCEGSNSEEAIWSCTTCGACMEVCPVFIEQMPKIIKMRRHLVETEAKFPEELLNLFENMEQRSNPWGIVPADRAKISSGADIKLFESGKTEYLFYVGCAGSFDSRSKQVTFALANILNKAGISWGILGKDEKCCGDSVRKLGNEFLYDKMANENIKMFKEKGITKIITQCPHCFSTFKNDYKQFGIELEVIHHSELINRLIKEGKISVDSNNVNFGNVVFHDSCYLARHNNIINEPREIIQSATGKLPIEMERNKKNSFCCGAGGGRMWMEENIGTRINIERVKESLSKNPDTLCVTCPYCLTMFEDGLKDEKADKVSVKDIAEIVSEGLK